MIADHVAHIIMRLRGRAVGRFASAKPPYRFTGLKAAYLQALEAGKGEQHLAKQLKIAWYEKNRYFANRIAQTELHRAYTDQLAADLMAEPKLQYVQIRLSQKHLKTDICDLHTKQDKYGLGAGVYPKAAVPPLLPLSYRPTV